MRPRLYIQIKSSLVLLTAFLSSYTCMSRAHVFSFESKLKAFCCSFGQKTYALKMESLWKIVIKTHYRKYLLVKSYALNFLGSILHFPSKKNMVALRPRPEASTLGCNFKSINVVDCLFLFISCFGHVFSHLNVNRTRSGVASGRKLMLKKKIQFY